MAARILHTLTDDNPDLQNQIGCITGIFQLFDRQPILAHTGPGRRIVGHSPISLLPGNAHSSGGPSEREFSNSHPKPASLVDKYPTKNMHDRHRVSTESSRASFSSSSRSSSFSSLDCNRGTQLEPASYDRIIFPETPSRDPTMSLQSTLSQCNGQSLDLKDLVKDSMYREIHLSVKSKPKDKSKEPNQKHRNSPRQLSKYIDGDLKESLKSLHKFQEASWYQKEPRQLSRSLSYHSRDGSGVLVSEDVPRFSYDGREVNITPFDSVDISKSSLKFKDLPRLSLDSSEGSVRSINADFKTNYPTRTIQRDVSEFDMKIKNQARSPSVVAKLMGLDTLPPDSTSDINTGSSRSFVEADLVSVSNLFATTNTNKPAQSLNWSSNVCKEPSSPSWKNPNMSMKHMLRFPVEPAPWKQSDGARGIQKPSLRNVRSPIKTYNTVSSVYSEIEKRLKDLKFTQSGKDLRALKQILEAMQDKGLLETGQDRQGSNYLTHKTHDQELLSSGQNSRFVSKQKPQSHRALSPTNRRVSSLRNYDSPIVIMKPAKLVEKSGIPAASVISLVGYRKSRGMEFLDNRKSSNVKPEQMDNALNTVNSKAGRITKSMHNSTKSLNLPKDSNAGLGKNSNSNSPRLLQKKMEMDKRARPPTPPDSTKSRKQSKKQEPDSVSPGGKRRSKYLNPKPSSDQLSDTELSQPENEKLLRRAASASRKSKVTEMRLSPGRNPTQSSKKGYEVLVSGLDEKNSGMVLSEEESAEFPHVLEYSSPVSVLDNLVHKDDSCSQFAGKSLQVDLSMGKHSDTTQDSSVYNIVHSTESSCSSEINRKKLQNIDNLVQKLRRLNSNHDEERTDYIASLCDNTDPDDRYISEILLASGLLLRDLSSSLSNFQFHPSGHPINPELFLVLEQTKKKRYNTEKTAQLMTNEKLQRMLIFDTVNEILARKLACSGPIKVMKKPINGQKLLKELCSEIDGLQPKSLKCNSEEEDDRWKLILCNEVMNHNWGSWINFDDEISDAVLAIERMVFKDLVNEVIGDPAGMVIKSGKRSRIVSN